MVGWSTVSQAEAEAHPLFGLRGWLRIPSVLFVLTLIGIPVMLVQGQIPPPSAWSAWEVLGAVVALGLPLAAVLWFRRWRHFRLGYLAYALVSGAFEVADLAWAAPRAADPGGEVALTLLSFAAEAAFLVAMQRSRRFRITFEHRLR
jgi:hypothetical protein